MYQIDFHKPLSIHFIGIGGISMSGLAEILLEEDFRISGSDAKKSPLTSILESKGCSDLLRSARFQYFKMMLRWLFIQQPSIRITRNLHVRKKKASDADPCGASRTDHAQLRYIRLQFPVHTERPQLLPWFPTFLRATVTRPSV